MLLAYTSTSNFYQYFQKSVLFYKHLICWSSIRLENPRRIICLSSISFKEGDEPILVLWCWILRSYKPFQSKKPQLIKIKSNYIALLYWILYRTKTEVLAWFSSADPSSYFDFSYDHIYWVNTEYLLLKSPPWLFSLFYFKHVAFIKHKGHIGMP